MPDGGPFDTTPPLTYRPQLPSAQPSTAGPQGPTVQYGELYSHPQVPDVRVKSQNTDFGFEQGRSIFHRELDHLEIICYKGKYPVSNAIFCYDSEEPNAKICSSVIQEVLRFPRDQFKLVRPECLAGQVM